MKRQLIWVSAALLAIVLCGCAADNNYLQARDFADHLRRCGVTVGTVRELRPDPFRASSGVGIMVGNSEIGVYKYDRSSKVQEKRIQRIAAEGRTYINGIPYPVEVFGSFMVMGLDKNVHKREILKALKSFK